MGQRLGTSTLIAYGALALPLAALNLPLYVYLPTFYSTRLGVPLATVGAVLLIARLFDMATDPLLGEIGDRARSRLGRRRPWLVAGTPLLLVSMGLLFLPPEGAGAGHLLLWSVVGYLAWTMMLLSYTAWGAELSGQYHERTRITAARESFVILGIALAAALPAVLGVDPGSGEALAALFWLTALTLPVTLIWLLVRVGEPPLGGQRALPLAAAIAALVGNRPFLRLIAAYLLNSLANGLPATLFLLFVQHVIGAGAEAGALLLVYFGCGLVSVPLWLRLSYRLGKSRTWAASMLWACLVFAYVPFLGPGDLWPFAVACVLSGLSLGADLALPASMQADVVDLDRLATGRNRTGLFFALWSMTTKLAAALAVGIAFPLLDLIGFAPTGTSSAAALLGLALLYAGLPVLLKLGAVALVWRFPLDAAAQAELRRRLEPA